MRSWLLLPLLAASSVRALWRDGLVWQQYRDGSDMQQFVTRPEIKAPRYMVVKHDDNITPGYWFVTPYTNLAPVPSTRKKEFGVCSTGLHIYDGDGELVWSGACMYDNRITFNFRPQIINGSTFFTFFLPGEQREALSEGMFDRIGSGVLMDHQYREVSRFQAGNNYLMDGHEFRIMPDGNTILLTTLAWLEADAATIGQEGTRLVVNTGFQEKRMDSSEVFFNWDPLENGVLLSESCDQEGMVKPVGARAWDFFHINSVDKFANGDYLVSSRYTSTLYRVSGLDGHIVWRLGGCYNQSNFVMEDGVGFHWQHHGRIRYENETHTILSVFDNGSEDRDRGPPTGHNPATGKVILLDERAERMTATMLRRLDRPDGGQSPALGAVTVLGDNVETANIFIDWAYDGYISEFDGNNNLLLEAKFVSDRKRTYRAYKFDFQAAPIEPPVLKVLPIGYSQDEAASAFYVSWNGATEVKSWAFYGSEHADGTPFRHLATVKRRGFETSWVTSGIVVQYAYAEALDCDGNPIGRSETTSIAPVLDTKFSVTYPALVGVKVGRGISRIQRGFRSTSPYLLVELFAVFGLVTVLRRLVPKSMGVRRGHRSIRIQDEKV